MSVFANYAAIYDALNAEKDYRKEAEFVTRLLREIRPAARTLVNFGCGTGQHDLVLAAQDFKTLGVELSPHMLEQAKRRRTDAGISADLVRFTQGDLRDFDAGERFDAVVSLFHVISYQTSNADIAAAFKTLGGHMADDSIALFDLWHGPAVENLRPETRVRRAESEAFNILRIAEPHHRRSDKIVEVLFTFFIEDKVTGAISRFEELHPMRYFFPEEIHELTRNAGLRLIDSGEWMTGNTPDDRTWSVYYRVEKKKG